MTVIVYADQSLPPTVGDVISGVQCLHLVAADMRPFVGPSGYALVTRFKRT